MCKENQHALHRGRVLIIDDSRSIQRYVSELLAEAGYDVSSAFDGISGLDLIAGTEPDVVLLDVEMPGMDGIQVLGRLAETKHLFAVIMFTTNSSLEQIVGGLNKGADDYITKPFQAVELLARVAAAERSVALKRELALARRQANESLMQLHKTQAQLVEEKKIRAISRLAAGVAHEINSPLGFIKSNLSTLGKYSEYLIGIINDCLDKTTLASQIVASSLAFDQKKFNVIRKDMSPLLQETQDGFFRIAEIVRNFTLIEQATCGVKAQEEDLNDILAGIVNTVQFRLPPTIQLILDLAPSPMPITGNLTMLNTLFTNILNNAVEAVGGAAEITIQTEKGNDTISCIVADSGCGITEENLPNVFDPFFTTRTSGHFGLGLTVAQCFVQAHLGAIKMVSSGGCGTRVFVSFPAVAN